jgi:hypothetical protein
VSRWILVTNILANPNDEKAWQDEVVETFHKDGLKAEYWGIKTLEGKLAEHPEVRDVFFEGENRVLVSLKEAHDRLRNECLGGESLENPLVGREAELQSIDNFVKATEKRVLPIVGPPGIGKSRLMYESLALLGQTGWRVLWALPEAMSRSSTWFQLLNGNQPTCVAIDDPNDPDLLKAVIEQLAPIERRNWKIIVACRSPQAEMLRRYQRAPVFAEAIRLGPMDEAQSKQLITLNCTRSFSGADHLVIFTHAGGVPGWLCLVADLANRNMLPTLPRTVDDIASLYVEKCLEGLEAAQRDKGQELLRYLALWAIFARNPNITDHSQSSFLAGQELSESEVRNLLAHFVKAGIVRNWGFEKRLYAIQPMIVREHILSSWLFDGDGDSYRVNAEGKRMIDLLVKGKIPAVDSALRSITHLTRSRLESSKGFSFLKPVFEELMVVARDGTVVAQSQLLSLIAILGASDPESALDCVKAIRENGKSPVEVEDPLWGRITFTHKSVLAKLPWVLFQVAAFVRDSVVATRYLVEFRHLLECEAALGEEIETGKGPRKLLEQLLCESKNAIVFAEPAKQTASKEIADPASWPFVGILLECLLKPEREYAEWTSRWTLTLTRRAITPNFPEWDMAAALREESFELLRSNSDSGLRSLMWRILAESHQQFQRMVLHTRLQGSIAEAYRAVLVNDLKTCAVILEKPPIPITLEETVAARKMWSWNLEYGKEEDLVALARRCEEACDTLSKWRLQDFFRFATGDTLAPETERVATLLRNAADTGPFSEFFAAVKTYLRAARSGGQDMADAIRITALADTLFDDFEPRISPDKPHKQVTAYVAAVLAQPRDANEFAWWFAVRVCQKYLLRIKGSPHRDRVITELKALIGLCQDKGLFLFELYANAHPLNTGNLSSEEFECLIANESSFTTHRLFIIFGAFASLIWTTVEPYLKRVTSSMKGQSAELDRCIGAFVHMLEFTALRYGRNDLVPQIEWIIEAIIENDLDGAILESSALTWMRKQCDYRLNISQLTRLLRTRMELEGKPRSRENVSVLPFDFDISEWCRRDVFQQEDEKAFNELCSLGLKNSFIGIHEMPKFIALLDSTGNLVARFVEQHLNANPSISSDELARLAYLASAYSDGSAAWAQIASPICAKSAAFTRQERERVFFGLSRKASGVISSAPGEVPDYYIQMHKASVSARNAEPATSPLQGYREWALRCAETELERQRQLAEEVSNG